MTDPIVETDPVEEIDVETLPPDEGDFYPCEEHDHEELAPLGLLTFGTTSHHVLATWLPAAFKKWGVKFKVASGWEDRGRPMSSGYFDPNGLLIHHTGSTSSASSPFPSLRTVIEGRSDLTGPLCQTTLGFDGVTVIVAAGRANHAGKARAAMGNPAGDGNTMYLGNEVQTNGTQKMPKVQYDALVLSSAAILDHFGYRNANKLGLHATTSLSGKWDLGAGDGTPGKPYDINKLRADVTARLKAGPPKPPAPPVVNPTPAPTPQKENKKMLKLVKLKGGDGAYWLTDLIHRRWVRAGADITGVKAFLTERGLPTTVQEVDSLEAYGVVVGPEPTP